MNFKMKLLKIIGAAKMLGKADEALEAQSQFTTTHRCYLGKIICALGLAGDQGVAGGDSWSGITCSARRRVTH